MVYIMGMVGNFIILVNTEEMRWYITNAAVAATELGIDGFIDVPSISRNLIPCYYSSAFKPHILLNQSTDSKQYHSHYIKDSQTGWSYEVFVKPFDLWFKEIENIPDFSPYLILYGAEEVYDKIIYAIESYARIGYTYGDHRKIEGLTNAV